MVVLEVIFLFALLDLVQRRLRDVDVSALDQVEHLPIEKSQQERADMRSIDVGVGHDDDAVITQLVRVVLVLAETCSQRRDQRQNFLRADQLFEARPFNVQDLAPQRQDRLKLPIAPLLGRSTRGITLDEIDFAQGGVAFLAIGQLARQAHPVQDSLAPREFPRLARRFTRAGRVDDLAANDPRIRGILQQELVELAAHDLLHDRLHLGGHQLVLRLRGEFGLWYLDRQHARETLTHVISSGFYLRFFRQLLFFDIAVQRARHRLAKAREVGSSVALRNVVGETLHRLRIGIVPLHRNLDDGSVLFADGVENLRVQHALAAIHVFDEGPYTAGEGEIFTFAIALIDELDLDAIVEKRKFANPPGENLVVILDNAEGRLRRHEMNLGAAALGRTDHCQRRDGNAVAELDLIRLAVAPDLEFQPL